MTESKAERHYRAQVGALPVRRSRGGTEVLLVTSRETRRWIIPKGWPMKAAEVVSEPKLASLILALGRPRLALTGGTQEPMPAAG